MNRIEFHARFGSMLVSVGGVALAITLGLTIFGTSPALAFAPVVCVALGVANMTTPLVVLEERWFSARPAVLRGVREILYTYVRGMELQGNKLVVRLDASAGGDCVIAMSSFDPDARTRIEKELAARVEGAGRASTAAVAR